MPDQNLSGVPPVVTLSGIPGVGSFSGQGVGGLSGGGAPGGQTPFGMEGGPDLLQQLMAQLSGSGGASAAAGLGLGSPLTAPSFGQQTGGLGSGSFSQQGGMVAGQTAAGGNTGSATGSIDPLALAQKVLGLGSKVSQALSGSQTASPTVGDTGGTSLSDQVRSGQEQPSTASTASPVTGQTGVGSIPGLADVGSSIAGGVGAAPGSGFGSIGGSASGLNDPNAVSQSYLNQGGGSFGIPPALANLGVTQDNLQAFVSALSGMSPEQIPGFSAEAAMGGIPNLQGGDLSGVSGGLSGGGGLDSFGAGAAGLGGLSSLLSAIQGFKGGTASGAVGGTSGLLGAIQALNALATGTEVGSAALAASPALSAISGAVSGLSGTTAAAAPIIAALVSYLGNQEEMSARNSGAVNNPIKGGLSSGATAGVGSANSLLSQVQQGGGLGNLSVEQEQGLLPQLLNDLMPYYATAEGPRGAVKASDTFTGGTGGAASKPLGGADQYTQNFSQAQSGLMDVINDLMRKGVSYEQLGQLPDVNPNWSMQTLDAAGGPQQFYDANKAQYDQSAQPFLQQAQQSGIQLQPGQLTPELLFQAMQGSAGMAPDAKTHASGLISSMYGGPLWNAIARMGAGGPEMQGMIQSHFNPWATAQGFSPEQFGTALQPLVSAQDLTAGQRYQDFTSGGG